jgi:hypothetical protein
VENYHQAAHVMMHNLRLQNDRQIVARLGALALLGGN